MLYISVYCVNHVLLWVVSWQDLVAALATAKKGTKPGTGFLWNSMATTAESLQFTTWEGWNQKSCCNPELLLDFRPSGTDLDRIELSFEGVKLDPGFCKTFRPLADWKAPRALLANLLWNTVDGKNPAPVDMVNIPLFIRFYTGGAGFPPPTVVDS